MSGRFVKLTSNANGRVEHAGVDAGYCEAGFFLLLCMRKTSVDHAHFCVGHAPFRSRLLLNRAAARNTMKEPVSFLIVAVINKAKTPKIM